MVRGFKDKDVEALFYTERASKRLAPYAAAALRKLYVVDSVESLDELAVVPGNQLKKVAGTKSTYQVRIDGKFRVRFTWDGRNAQDVEVGDFH